MSEIINNIDYNNLIQNLSGIGAFITSLITLFTLIVLIKQRKDSFRPIVIFGDRLEAKCIIDNDEDLFKKKWVDAYPNENEEFHDLCFELLNVGVGVAENVRVYEKFDYKKAIKFIKTLDKDNVFKFEIEDDVLHVTTSFDDSFNMIFLKEEPRELGTYITRQQEKPNKYVFTDSCLIFLACFDHLRDPEEPIVNLDEFPNCYYEIQYKDIEGKKYKVNYSCQISSILRDTYTFTFIKK